MAEHDLGRGEHHHEQHLVNTRDAPVAEAVAEKAGRCDQRLFQVIRQGHATERCSTLTLFSGDALYSVRTTRLT